MPRLILSSAILALLLFIVPSPPPGKLRCAIPSLSVTCGSVR